MRVIITVLLLAAFPTIAAWKDMCGDEDFARVDMGNHSYASMSRDANGKIMLSFVAQHGVCYRRIQTGVLKFEGVSVRMYRRCLDESTTEWWPAHPSGMDYVIKLFLHQNSVLIEGEIGEPRRATAKGFTQLYNRHKTM